MKLRMFFLSLVLLFGAGVIALSIMSNASTDTLLLEADKTKVQRNDKINLKVTFVEADHGQSFRLQYPDGFEVDEQAIKETNKEKISKIKNEPSVRQLDLTLNNEKEILEINLFGTATTYGNKKFTLSDVDKNILSKEASVEVLDDSPEKVEGDTPEKVEGDTPEKVEGDTPEKVEGGAKQKKATSLVSQENPIIDDPGDLDGWVSMTANEPVEFHVDKNPSNRKYYMYFGNVATNPLEPAKAYSAMGSPLGDDNKDNHADIGLFQILTKTNMPGDGAAGKNQEWMSFYYNKGMVNLGGGLQISKTPGATGKPQIIDGTSQTSLQQNGLPIDKLYKNADPDNPQLRAYSYVKEGTTKIGILRITLTPVGSTGRVKTDIRFASIAPGDSYYTFMWAIHSDLAGNHYGTDTISLGGLNGFYVGIDGVSASPGVRQITPDKGPYRLYFFNDGYNGEADDFVLDEFAGTSTSPSYYYKDISSPGLRTDINKGERYDVKHPVYSFKWSPKLLSTGNRMEIRQDLAVTEDKETPKLPPTLSLDQTSGEYSGGNYTISGTWIDVDSAMASVQYQIDGGAWKEAAKGLNMVQGEPNKWTYDIPAAELPVGVDHVINVKAIDDTELESEVKTLNLKPTSKFAPILTIDKTEDFYDEGSYPLEGLVEDKDSPWVYIEWKLDDGPWGRFSGAESISSASNTANFIREVADLGATEHTLQVRVIDGDNLISNVCIIKLRPTPKLTFVEAPTQMDFGKVSISSQKEVYPLTLLDGNLVVKDSRVNGTWSLVGELDKQLTSTTNVNHQLTDALYFREAPDALDIVFPQVSFPVVNSHVTTSEDPVNVSSQWLTNKAFELHVPPGMPKAEQYKATIKWTLQDVVANE